MKTNFRGCLFYTTLLASAFLVVGPSANAAGVVEPTGINFTSPDGFGERAIVLPDGASIVAGQFDVVQGEPRNGIARLRADGSLDVNWKAACTGTVGYGGCWFRQIELGADGWVYVRGEFSRIGGQVRNGLARIALADGRVDEAWNPISAGEERPHAFVLAPDGLIASSQNLHTKYDLTDTGAAIPSFQTTATHIVGYAGGWLFGTAQSSPPTLIRIDAQTGQTDDNWTAGVSVAAWLLADAESASIIGRTAATQEEPTGRLVKVSALANPGLQADWQPPAIGSQHFVRGGDGDLHLIDPGHYGFGQGRLTTIDLGGVGAIVRQLDLPLITNSWVVPLAVDATGAAILSAYAAEDVQPSGWTADGSTIGRVTATGAVDPQWRSGVYAYGSISAVEKTPDGGILVAGAFDRVSGVPRRGIAKFNAALQLDPWEAQVPQSHFTAASVDAAGNVYVSSRAGPATLLKLSGNTGAIDAGWNPSGVAGPPIGEIDELVVDRTNNVLYARFPHFSFEICGSTRSAMAKLSLGSTCVPYPAVQIQPASPLLDLLVHEGSVYITGRFNMVGGEAIASLARLDSNGVLDSAWRPFGSSAFPGPTVVRAQATPRGLIAGGAFASVQGQSRPGIALFDVLTGNLDHGWGESSSQKPVYSIGTLGEDVLAHRWDSSTPGSSGQLTLIPLSGNGGEDPAWPALEIESDDSSGSPIFMIPLDANSTFIVGAFKGMGDTTTGNTAVLRRQPVGVFADGFESSPHTSD